MRLTLVTDAWAPQINGVVRTLSTMKAQLEAMGDEVTVIHPGLFHTIPCPTYPEIRLAIPKPGMVGFLIEASRPDAIHIATEGPLGFLARRHAMRSHKRFTTAYHTKFPEYVEARTGLSPAIGYSCLRRFHGPSAAVLAPTPAICAELEAQGFTHVEEWGRGVDTDLFHPNAMSDLSDNMDLPRPWLLYVGRVAVEKNIEAFLALEQSGTLIVVGDGPMLPELKRKHPNAVFLGKRTGQELSALYAEADVFVFPSRTDTFGLVLLEALASGTPVAAYPVPGPIDVITDPRTGILDEDLGRAVTRALLLDRRDCRAHAETRSWRACAERFRSLLVPCASPGTVPVAHYDYSP